MEYKFDNNVASDKLEALLNKRTEEGWRLVEILNTAYQSDHLGILFERRKKDVRPFLSDYDILLNEGYSEDEAKEMIARGKIQKLQDLKLQLMAQNPQLLGVALPGQGNFGEAASC